MQQYRLIGTVFSPCRRAEVVQAFIKRGWRHTSIDKETDNLTLKGFKFICEGEQTLLVEAAFKGEVEDVRLFLDCLETLPLNYSLDLFGDSARLVRRCIR